MNNNYKCYINLARENEYGLVAYATVIYNGLRIHGIQVRMKKDGENTYIEFPGQMRKDRDGNYVKGEDGYNIKDYTVNPVTKEARADIEALIDAALAEALDKAQ